MTFGFCGTIVIPGGSDDDDAAVVLTVVARPWPYCFGFSLCVSPSMTTSGSSSAGLEENVGSVAEAEGLALALFWAMALVGEEESG